MKLSAEQERLKDLLTDTITLLCKNGLQYRQEFSVEALIGITLDKEDVFLVNIKEIVKNALAARTEQASEEAAVSGSDSESRSGSPRKRRRKRKPSRPSNATQHEGPSQAKQSRGNDDDETDGGESADDHDDDYGHDDDMSVT